MVVSACLILSLAFLELRLAISTTRGIRLYAFLAEARGFSQVNWRTCQYFL